MQLHNTLSGRKERFEPLDPSRVTMYVCGPTVYSYAHIGNARPAVVFDVLARVLRRRYQGVVYARNITDVDDKINKAAAEQGVDIGAITDKFTRIYHEDLAALGVARPDIEPRVTAHMEDIVAMIGRIVAAGHGYAAEGHVLFDVPSYAGYGELSGRDRRELIAGARVDVAPYKKDPGDFVLWKPSKPGEPKWPSPWGEGRPGWHIECSAMSARVLGETIDIHGGGHDLVFPHHENERAQSTCAHGGKPFARYWVHNGFLTMNSAKMAKSVGNVLRVHDLVKVHPGEAIRLALLNGHYRQPLDWTDDTVPQARAQLDRLYGALRELEDVPAAAGVGAPQAVVDALEDDLNTPQAIAALFESARAARAADAAARPSIKAQLLDAGSMLGLLQQQPTAWFRWQPAGAARDDGAVQRLIDARTAARKSKDYAEGDRLKAELVALGVSIEDTPQGTRWRWSADSGSTRS
ncbi:MAG TPA: cysteine--tRNA ligase [Verrucomicrobiae bacterium]|nr:cysteine--tRNA ligase [Verrucomicrobiae bacterium]